MRSAILKGFEKLLRTSGEDLEFRGSTVRGVVNRQSPDENNTDGYEFSGREGARIQIPLSVKPKTGEELKDAFGFYHRIQTYRHLGHCYELNCESSEA